jgi:hypothetical protein
MTEQDLASKLKGFRTRANSLEEERLEYVEDIISVVKREVLQDLSVFLSNGYTIKPDGIYVQTSNKQHEGGVPLNFEVNIQLLYNGNPIGVGDEGLREIAQEFRPEAEQLAKKYELDKISVSGEPIMLY